MNKSHESYADFLSYLRGVINTCSAYDEKRQTKDLMDFIAEKDPAIEFLERRRKYLMEVRVLKNLFTSEQVDA